MEATTDPQLDALASLEARIAKAVSVIGQLRQERDSAREEAELLRLERDELREKLAKMEAERETMQSERKAVRARIEKLLGQMDLISSDS
jgi:regulator of replication initiation timing